MLARIALALSLAVSTPAAPADLNGDGRSDIVWRNVDSGDNYVFFMNGLSVEAEGFIRAVADPRWEVAGVGDFDQDGKADILWRNQATEEATGENYLFPMDATSILPSEGYVRTVADPEWKVRACADYNGDGKADVLWRHATTGENYFYPMDGTTILPTEGYLRTVADPDWEPR